MVTLFHVQPDTGGKTFTNTIATQGQKYEAERQLLTAEYLSRIGQSAFRRWFKYISGFRRAAISGDWSKIEWTDGTELDTWDKEFFEIPWNDGSKNPGALDATNADIEKVAGAYSMKAFIYAAQLAAYDMLVFFDRTDYNLYYALGLGLPSPLNVDVSKRWDASTKDDYGRGPLRVRWKQKGNVWCPVLRGDSFGLDFSVMFDYSAIRLSSIGQSAGGGITVLEDNPEGR